MRTEVSPKINTFHIISSNISNLDKKKQPFSGQGQINGNIRM